MNLALNIELTRTFEWPGAIITRVSLPDLPGLDAFNLCDKWLGHDFTVYNRADVIESKPMNRCGLEDYKLTNQGNRCSYGLVSEHIIGA